MHIRTWLLTFLIGFGFSPVKPLQMRTKAIAGATVGAVLAWASLAAFNASQKQKSSYKKSVFTQRLQRVVGWLAVALGAGTAVICVVEALQSGVNQTADSSVEPSKRAQSTQGAQISSAGPQGDSPLSVQVSDSPELPLAIAHRGEDSFSAEGVDLTQGAHESCEQGQVASREQSFSRLQVSDIAQHPLVIARRVRDELIESDKNLEQEFHDSFAIENVQLVGNQYIDPCGPTCGYSSVWLCILAANKDRGCSNIFEWFEQVAPSLVSDGELSDDVKEAVRQSCQSDVCSRSLIANIRSMQKHYRDKGIEYIQTHPYTYEDWSDYFSTDQDFIKLCACLAGIDIPVFAFQKKSLKIADAESVSGEGVQPLDLSGPDRLLYCNDGTRALAEIDGGYRCAIVNTGGHWGCLLPPELTIAPEVRAVRRWLDVNRQTLFQSCLIKKQHPSNLSCLNGGNSINPANYWCGHSCLWACVLMANKQGSHSNVFEWIKAVSQDLLNINDDDSDGLKGYAALLAKRCCSSADEMEIIIENSRCQIKKLVEGYDPGKIDVYQEGDDVLWHNPKSSAWCVSSFLRLCGALGGVNVNIYIPDEKGILIQNYTTLESSENNDFKIVLVNGNHWNVLLPLHLKKRSGAPLKRWLSITRDELFTDFVEERA